MKNKSPKISLQIKINLIIKFVQELIGAEEVEDEEIEAIIEMRGLVNKDNIGKSIKTAEINRNHKVSSKSLVKKKKSRMQIKVSLQKIISTTEKIDAEMTISGIMMTTKESTIKTKSTEIGRSTKRIWMVVILSRGVSINQKRTTNTLKIRSQRNMSERKATSNQMTILESKIGLKTGSKLDRRT